MNSYPLLIRSPRILELVEGFRKSTPEIISENFCNPVLVTAEDSRVAYPGFGRAVDTSELSKLRLGLLKSAKQYGYPGPIRGKENGTEVDRLWGTFLVDTVLCTPHQGFKSAMWEYFTVVLAPDLVQWRWQGSRDIERWLGPGRGVRNCFARVWRRAWTLHNPESSDPHRLFCLLFEDELAQIDERPRIAGNRDLARKLAQIHLELHGPGSTTRMVDMREHVKRLMRLGAFLPFSAMDPESLDRIVRESASPEAFLHLR